MRVCVCVCFPLNTRQSQKGEENMTNLSHHKLLGHQAERELVIRWEENTPVVPSLHDSFSSGFFFFNGNAKVDRLSTSDSLGPWLNHHLAKERSHPTNSPLLGERWHPNLFSPHGAPRPFPKRFSSYKGSVIPHKEKKNWIFRIIKQKKKCQ